MAADLEPNELKQASELKNVKLIQIVSKAIEDAEISRVGLNSML